MTFRLKSPLVHAIPGDHHFSDPSSGILFRTDDFPALLAKITDYRVGNGLPMGDPEQEVLQFYAKSFPWSVIEEKSGKILSDTNGSVIDNPDTNPANLSQSERLYRWVNEVWRNPPTTLLHSEDATSRVSYCQKCPHHRPPTSDTPQNEPRAKEANRRVMVLTKCRPAPGVGFCAHFGWDCRLACLLSHLSEVDGPEKCWVVGSKQEMPTLLPPKTT